GALTGFIMTAAAAHADPMAADAPWKALPSQTIAAVRFHDPAGALELLRGTRFGQAALSEQRLQSAFDLMRKQVGGEWHEMVADLERHGLTTDDLVTLAGKPFGAALVFE